MKEFKTFAAFAAHLDRLAASSGEVKHHMLEKAGDEVQKTAQGMIGDYQEAMGSFRAWEELADSTQAERARLGFSENDPGFRTGQMQRSIQHSVGDSEMAVGSSDQHLVWFDQGTPNQPPRAVFGPAAIHSEGRVRKILGATVLAWLAGKGWRRPQISAD